MPSKTLEVSQKDQDIKPSWAEQVELGDDGSISSPTDVLPPPSEVFDKKTGLKTVVEFKFNEDGKKVKVIKTYKVETCKVSRTIARRKLWKKFGDMQNDPTGPNPASTKIEEDISITYIHSKELADQDDDPLSKLKGKMVMCRICKGDHWTTKCPYKDSLVPLQESNPEVKKEEQPAHQLSSSSGQSSAQKPGKYIPPSMREGGNKKGESMSMRSRGDDAATIRVTNLSEDTRESDLQELFRPFGLISRIFLAKDKASGQSKGFAFINFHHREDAARAIKGVSGYGYDHLILNVEWAKPSPS